MRREEKSSWARKVEPRAPVSPHHETGVLQAGKSCSSSQRVRGRPAILMTPSSPPRRRSVESWGMPPSIRLAGFRSRCTQDILFLLQACPAIA